MKVTNILYSVALLSTVMATTSCSHEKIELYSGCKAGIYIQEAFGSDAYGNVTSYREGDDRFTFTKYDEKTTTAQVSFNVKLMGDVVDYDRPYAIAIVPEETDAIEGVDFTLDGNKFCIGAGKNYDNVKVTLLRNPGLIQRKVKVTLQISANENFETPIVEYKNSGAWNIEGPIADATKFWVEFGEAYSKPDQWDNGSRHYGAWSVNKFLLLNKIMGWTVNDWDVAGAYGSKIGLGRLQFAASALQMYLQDMADAGTPVLDDDGSYMQLNANYMVDYSAYK